MIEYSGYSLLDEETATTVIRVEYDPKADAMYIWLRKARYEISEKLAENVIIALIRVDAL